jgi:hypothetical protein
MKTDFKNHILSGMFITCLAITFQVTGVAQVSGDKPNLLFIMTDQQRFDAMICAGNTVLETPNMDRIAS